MVTVARKRSSIHMTDGSVEDEGSQNKYNTKKSDSDNIEPISSFPDIKAKEAEKKMIKNLHLKSISHIKAPSRGKIPTTFASTTTSRYQSMNHVPEILPTLNNANERWASRNETIRQEEQGSNFDTSKCKSIYNEIYSLQEQEL